MATVRSLLSSTSLPKNEARILLAHVLEVHLQLPKSALLSRDDLVLSEFALSQWHALEAGRLRGEPIAYLIGRRGFHAIDLAVGPGVLIPRPETELLVDIALTELARLDSVHLGARQPLVLDLGTGSGAIALALAHSNPSARVMATDASLEALIIAKHNAQALGLEDRVSFCSGSWYAALSTLDNWSADTQFDLILSNPPYIKAGDPHLSQGDLRFEPVCALTDHGTGLGCLSAIIEGAPDRLWPGGLLAVEHGFDQSDQVLALMRLAGLTELSPQRDLAGQWRVACGRMA